MNRAVLVMLYYTHKVVKLNASRRTTEKPYIYIFINLFFIQGDSGGPLLCRSNFEQWFVGGIVSWGIKCAHPHLPGVYAYVPRYVKWIQEIMDKYSYWVFRWSTKRLVPFEIERHAETMLSIFFDLERSCMTKKCNYKLSCTYIVGILGSNCKFDSLYFLYTYIGIIIYFFSVGMSIIPIYLPSVHIFM